MEYSIEIRPLSETEFDNVNGGGNVGNLYFYNEMRDFGLTTEDPGRTARLSEIFKDRHPPEPPLGQVKDLG